MRKKSTQDKWTDMLTKAHRETKKRHPRVCRFRNRDVSHFFAYAELLAQIGRELFPDFDQVRTEYVKQLLVKLDASAQLAKMIRRGIEK